MFSFVINLQENKLELGPWQPLFYKFLSDASFKFIDNDLQPLPVKLKNVATQVESTLKAIGASDWQGIFVIKYMPDSNTFKGSLIYFEKLINDFFIRKVNCAPPKYIFLLLLDTVSLQENLEVEKIKDDSLKELLIFEKTGVSNLAYSLLNKSIFDKLSLKWKIKEKDIDKEVLNTGKDNLSVEFIEKFEKCKLAALALLQKEVGKINYEDYFIEEGSFLFERNLSEKILLDFEAELEACISNLNTRKKDFINIGKILEGILLRNVGIHSSEFNHFTFIRQEFIDSGIDKQHFHKLHELALSIYVLVSMGIYNDSHIITKGHKYFIKHNIKSSDLEAFFSDYLNGLLQIEQTIPEQDLNSYHTLKLKKFFNPEMKKRELEHVKWNFRPKVFRNYTDKDLLETELIKAKKHFKNLEQNIIPNYLLEIQNDLNNREVTIKNEEVEMKFRNSDTFFREIQKLVSEKKGLLSSMKDKLRQSDGKINSNLLWDNDIKLKKEQLISVLKRRPDKYHVGLYLLIPFFLLFFPVVLNGSTKPITFLILLIFAVITVICIFQLFKIEYRKEQLGLFKEIKKHVNKAFIQITNNFAEQQNYLAALFEIKINLENVQYLESLELEFTKEKNLTKYHREKISEHQNLAIKCLEYYSFSKPLLHERLLKTFTLIKDNPEFIEEVYQPQKHFVNEAIKTIIDVEGNKTGLNIEIPYLESTSLDKDKLTSKS